MHEAQQWLRIVVLVFLFTRTAILLIKTPTILAFEITKLSSLTTFKIRHPKRRISTKTKSVAVFQSTNDNDLDDKDTIVIQDETQETKSNLPYSSNPLPPSSETKFQRSPTKESSSPLPTTENLFDRRTASRNAVAWIAGIATTVQWATLGPPTSKQTSLSQQTSLATNELSASEPIIEQLPLEYIPTLNAYVVKYYLFGQAFRAIVDTGSPFLTVPCYCQPYRTQRMVWGCYQPERTFDSGYSNTIEGFDNNYGTVVWRKAGFSFQPPPQGSTQQQQEDSTQTQQESPTQQDVVFGVLDLDLLNGSGGVFFGLIKETDRWIRPSFLGQTGYKSFCINLTKNRIGSISVNDTNNNAPPRLVLSKESMIGTGLWRGLEARPLTADERLSELNRSVPLVRDLRTRYGAPVVHYTAKATKFVVNGMPLLITPRKPLYVVFDSGVSGMVVSQELFDGRYLQARKNREKSLWGTVEVTFATAGEEEITLRAQKPLATPLGKATPWKGFRGNLIAIGLAFLDGLAMTIDVDDGRILFAKDNDINNG